MCKAGGKRMKDFDVLFTGKVKDINGDWCNIELKFSDGKSHKDFIDSNQDIIAAGSKSEIVPKKDA